MDSDRHALVAQKIAELHRQAEIDRMLAQRPSALVVGLLRLTRAVDAWLSSRLLAESGEARSGLFVQS